MPDQIEPPIWMDGQTKCLTCIGEYQMALKDIEDGVLHDGEQPVVPWVADAISWAPSWQQTQIMGQMMVACVAIPTCMRHLSTEKKSPIQRASASGLMLGGPGAGAPN